jgi:heavy metal translocating P-type ATPase
MAIDYEVRHSMSGRVRLVIPAIKRTDGLAEGCAHFLKGLEGITGVRVSRQSASAVLLHNCHEREILPRVRKAMSKATLSALRSPAPLDREGQPEQPGSNSSGVEPGNSIVDTIDWGPLMLPTASLALTLSGAGSVFALPLIAYNAVPILKRALKVLSDEHRLNVDFLDSLAVILSTLQGNLFTSAFMTWLINLGDFIRDLTAAKSRRAMTALLAYQKKKAWVLRAKRKIEVSVSEIVVGDTVVVYAGGLIPVDGEVIKGRAAVDQQTITGESSPVEKRFGDKVYAATVLREGKLYVRAERVGNQTTAAQIVQLVEGAPVGETRIQNYAEKFADRLVAPSLAVAGGFYAVSPDTNRLVSMIITDYGTGIRVAAPTSVLASMRRAARHGILIKAGRHMERLNQVDTVIFDKTGTLTAGELRVLDVASFDERHFPARNILALAAAAEARLTHPVAQAVLTKAGEWEIQIPDRDESRYFIGLGVEVQVNGYHVHVGSERFLRQRGVHLDGASSLLNPLGGPGYSTLLVAVDEGLKGIITYSDVIRPESSTVLKALHDRGVRDVVMLTGDNSMVAASVAGRLGLNQFFSEVFPEEKANIVQQFQKEGRVVAMVGDGINDSPALAYADVGIAMKNGADIAHQAADVVLMEENLWKLINAFDISKEAIRLIRQNYAIIAGLNTLAFAMAVPRGLVNPGVTALISNGSAILASLNGVRPILMD